MPNLDTSCPAALVDVPFCAVNWKLTSAPRVRIAVAVDAVVDERFKLPPIVSKLVEAS